MESDILKHQTDRTKDFQPNQPLDNLILQLRALLAPTQANVNAKFEKSKYPVLLVLGNPRSGTTLLTQWLAGMECFSYPTNLLSRLAFSPYVGALIQQMLYNPEYDFRGEMHSQPTEQEFGSDIGKTTGPTAVSEFFHFWRRLFPNHDPGYLDKAELQQVRTDDMRHELASIESALKKPFISKGMMMQYNVAFFAEAIPEFFFLHIEREPMFVMQSVLQSKRRYYEDDNIWWSVKPKNFKNLKNRSPYHQVAGQLQGTLDAIKSGLQKVTDQKQLTVSYEAFCQAPSEIYDQLRSKYSTLGCDLPDYTGADSFSCTNKQRIENQEWEKLKQAYDELSHQ